MQIKMDKAANTPKGIKKTPKKMKETPLKKDETPKGTKTPTNTPKSNKKTPNKNNNNVTPKLKQQQQVKTPQSKPGTPKTPESNSKKRKPRSKGNKKQKLDGNKSIEINTHSPDEQIKKTSDLKKVTSTENSSKVKGSRVRVFFPPGQALTYNDIQKVFEGCENVLLPSVMIEYDPEIAPQKLEELSNLRYKGRRLRIHKNLGEINLLKKTIKLTNDEDKEKARKFFNAKSIEKLVRLFDRRSDIYILTFETEEKAAAASEMEFKLGDKVLLLQQYFERTVQNVTTAEGKKPSEAKGKQEQIKRKADEDEELDEEEDEELDEEKGDSTMEGIEMEDDDDDDDDDDEDEEDDDDDE